MTDDLLPSAQGEGGRAAGSTYVRLTANEVVAFNLARARKMKGWTQGEVATRLLRETGRPWTAATIGAAERSATSKRVRQFDANDLLGFALVFEQPLSFFFIPPVISGRKIVVRSSEADAKGGFTVNEYRLLEAVLPLAASPQLVLDVERVLNPLGRTWTPGTLGWYWDKQNPGDATAQIRGILEASAPPSSHSYLSLPFSTETEEDLEKWVPGTVPDEEKAPSELASALGIDTKILQAIIERSAEVAVRRLLDRMRAVEEEQEEG